jgi:hypothetical protein
MTHKRTTIRDAVVTAVTGLTTTGTNVTPSRVFNVETEALPHLSVYMGDEERSEESDSMSADLISAELIIEARAESTVEVDITADLMLEEGARHWIVAMRALRSSAKVRRPMPLS